MGIVHQQTALRARTIDARPNKDWRDRETGEIQGLKRRIAELEAEVASLCQELSSNVTRVEHNVTLNAERQRRYRERKKHGADTER